MQFIQQLQGRVEVLKNEKESLTKQLQETETARAQLQVRGEQAQQALDGLANDFQTAAQSETALREALREALELELRHREKLALQASNIVFLKDFCNFYTKIQTLVLTRTKDSRSKQAIYARFRKCVYVLTAVSRLQQFCAHNRAAALTVSAVTQSQQLQINYNFQNS